MILSGKIVAEKIYQSLRIKIGELAERGIRPGLAVILVGNNAASLAYTQIKKKRAEELGIDFCLHQIPTNVSQKEVEQLVNQLDRDPKINGLVIQLPLPENFETEKIIALISLAKDVDGFLGQFPSPTAAAILEILQFYQIGLKEKQIVLVGFGKLVGQPLTKLLQKKGLNPLVCNSKTKNLKQETLKADILVSATGVPGLIKSDFVKDGAVVIDAGTAEAKGKLRGDVDQEVYQKDISYTPTPGGVGPVTVAMLMKNVVEAATNQNGGRNG